MGGIKGLSGIIQTVKINIEKAYKKAGMQGKKVIREFDCR
jgi:hypothetical protein